MPPETEHMRFRTSIVGLESISPACLLCLVRRGKRCERRQCQLSRQDLLLAGRDQMRLLRRHSCQLREALRSQETSAVACTAKEKT
jgi:hypothetical protein